MDGETIRKQGCISEMHFGKIWPNWQFSLAIASQSRIGACVACPEKGSLP